MADPKRRYSIQDVVKHRWFTAEIDDDTSTLIRSSLIGKVESDVIEPIQESVVLLLQQKGFTLEQIADVTIFLCFPIVCIAPVLVLVCSKSAV